MLKIIEVVILKAIWLPRFNYGAKEPLQMTNDN